MFPLKLVPNVADYRAILIIEDLEEEVVWRIQTAGQQRLKVFA